MIVGAAGCTTGLKGAGQPFVIRCQVMPLSYFFLPRVRLHRVPPQRQVLMPVQAPTSDITE